MLYTTPETMSLEIKVSSNMLSTSKFSNTEQLRVLGLPNSGKTQFLEALRNNIPINPAKKDQTISKTGMVDIPAFSFISLGNRERNFTAKDINGSHEFLVRFINSCIKEADHLLFFCDIVSYLKNTETNGKLYQAESNKILRSISDNMEMNVHVGIILSYQDKLEENGYTSDEAMIRFKRYIEETPYANYPCYMVNTYNQKQVRLVFNNFLYGK